MAGFHPLGKRGLELLSIDQRHHPSPGVMAGRTRLKITVLTQKIQPRVAKILDLDPSFRTTNHRAYHQKKDNRELVLHFLSLAEVGNNR